jgi:hypothetical protein
MDLGQIVVDQYLIMLEGKPISLITRSGLATWENEGKSFTCRYDQITHEGEHLGKFRCLYEKEGSSEIFLLVEPPSSPDGFSVVLLDQPPQTIH